MAPGLGLVKGLLAHMGMAGQVDYAHLLNGLPRGCAWPAGDFPDSLVSVLHTHAFCAGLASFRH